MGWAILPEFLETVNHFSVRDALPLRVPLPSEASGAPSFTALLVLLFLPPMCKLLFRVACSIVEQVRT